MSASFITKFHNLSGKTIKEKQNNFYKLLNENRFLQNSEGDLQYILANFKPLNYFETILYVNFLIYFRCFDELLKKYQTGDELTIKKLRKQEWFYERAYQDVDCREFVAVILPQMSYALKLKLLKKLVLEESKADELFDLIEQQYGVFLATNLLPSCSSAKIETVLRQFPIRLSHSQLKRILDKNPFLLELYIDERVKQEGNSNFLNHKPILIYLAQKHPTLFVKVFQKYKLQVQLGRRTTKQLLKAEKTEIVKRKKHYLNILKKEVVVRKIGYELKDILFEKNADLNEEKIWMEIIKFYPKKKRFEFYKTNYDEIFHKKFGEDVTKLSEKEFELIDDLELREKLAKLKRLKEPNDVLMQFLKPETCLEEIYDRLGSSQANQRADFVKYAIRNCILNEDFVALQKVAELVAVRLKNDERSVRSCFLEALGEADDRILEKLDCHNWKTINEIISIVEVRKEWIYRKEKLQLYYLYYLLRNEKDVRDFLKQMGVEAISVLHCYSCDNKKNFRFLKEIIIALLDLGLVKPNPDEENSVESFDLNLIGFLKQFNEDYPSQRFDYQHPRVFKSLEKYISSIKDNCYIPHLIHEGIEYLICQKNTNSNLRKLYFENAKNLGRLSVFYWFLKNDPTVLDSHFELFMLGVVSVGRKWFWRLMKKLNYDEKVASFYLNKLQDEEFRDKNKIIKPLALLSKTADFLNLLQNYLPENDKVDLSDEKTKQLFEIQYAFVRDLALIESPYDVIETSFAFCRGDYLKVALGPLYSSIYRLPENETRRFMKRLRDLPAVSVQKHSIHLSLVVCDLETVKSFIQTTQLPVLLGMLRYFVKNPYNDLWVILNEKLSNLQKNELDTLKFALEMNFSADFRMRILEIVWELLERYEHEELRKIVMKKINKNCTDLSFAKKFIEANMFRNKDANESISTLLLHIENEEKFILFNNLLKTWKEKNWNDLKERPKNFKLFHQFFATLFEIYMKKESPKNDELVKKLTNILKENFKPIETFQELVLVKSLILKDGNHEKAAQFLLELTHSCCNEFGDFCIYMLAQALKFVFQHVFKRLNQKIELFHQFLQMESSYQNCLLVLLLLPAQVPENERYFILHQQIVEIVKKRDEDSVKLYLNDYLKK